MDDAVIGGFVVVLAALMGIFIWGLSSGVTKQAVKKDCDNFGYVVLENRKYQCSLVGSAR